MSPLVTRQVPLIESPPLILVVDDRPENLAAMQAVLENNHNWQLRCVNSGIEALRILLSEDISLVLLDVQMPEMDGYEVADLMRGNPHTRHTPIIFISAIAHTQDAILRGFSSGAFDFILKPFDPVILRHKISNLLAYENNRRKLQRTSEQLERERAFNASILANAAEGIMVVNGKTGAISYANLAIAQMLGLAIEDLKQRSFLSLFADNNAKQIWQKSAFYQHWQQHKIYRSADATFMRFDNKKITVAISAAPLSAAQQAMVVIVRDISVERSLLTKLENLIITDPLTGLLNRRGFYQALEAAISRIKHKESGNQLAVIYLDLDGFKRINDSLGHEAGDDLLRQISQKMQQNLHSYHALARMGGDEFTILLDSLDNTNEAARVASDLMQLVNQNYKLDDTYFKLSASAGIACYPECGQDSDSLLQAADMAMYEAKKAGRERYYFYSPQMTKHAHAQLKLEQQLRYAIENGGFNLNWQPQFYLASGKLRGFEALVRWQQDNPTNCTPDKFIPLLEETRLINKLGSWVFKAGLANLQDFRAHFAPNLVLSLNVSSVQFAATDLAANLTNLLQSCNLEGVILELEITETALMQDLEITKKQLHKLRNLGIKIAVDDFGTGYSSLAYLRYFELDTIKIDRMFISNMMSSESDAAIVKTIIELGTQLNLEIIAEGVETEEQRLWLAQNGCTIMQGWLAAPALSLAKALQVPTQLDWQQDLPLKLA